MDDEFELDEFDEFDDLTVDQTLSRVKASVSWLLMIREQLLTDDVDNAITFIEDKIWESLDSD